jgi:hypothetical protein
MKNKIFCILVVLMTSFFTYAQQAIYNDIDSDVEWDDQGTTPDYIVYNDISITNDATLTIDEYLTVQFIGDVTIEDGSTLIIEKGATLEFAGIWYQGGATYYYDGFKLIVEGTLTATDNDEGEQITFTKKSGTDGWGGIIFSGNTGNSLLNNCLVEETYKCNNYIPANLHEYCGAVYIYDNSGTVTINGCDISNNWAFYGGGLCCYNTGADVEITATVINYNYAYYDGGGAYLIAGGDAGFSSSNLNYNEANDGDGGGAYIDASEVLFEEDCQVKYNVSEDHGGGIAIVDGADLTIYETDFVDNESYNGNGGAIYNYNFCTADIRLCEFWENAASNGDGGAIYNYNSDLDLINNLIVWNTGGNGGAIFHYSNQGTADTVRINNNTIAKNEGDAGGGIYSDTMGSRFSVVNTIIWDNLGNSLCDDLSNLLPDAMFSYCDIEDGNLPSSGTPASYYTFSDDPEFVSNYDFRMSYGSSPCTDKGNSSVSPQTSEDLEGNSWNNTRIFNNATIDIGAYENDGTNPYILPPVNIVETPFVKTKLYPTINDGFFTIQSDKDISNISIMSIDGRLIFSSGPVNELNSIDIDISSHASGCYFVNIFTNTGMTYSSKVILK